VDNYARFLNDPGETLGRFSLDQIVAVWDPLLRTGAQRRWLGDFTDRYLNLQLNEVAWSEQ